MHYDRLPRIPPTHRQFCCIIEQLLYLLDLPRYSTFSIKTQYIQIKNTSKENHTICVFLNLTIDYTLYKLILRIILTEFLKTVSSICDANLHGDKISKNL